MSTTVLKEDARSDEIGHLRNVVDDIVAGKNSETANDFHKYMTRKVGSIINSRNLDDEIQIEES